MCILLGSYSSQGFIWYLYLGCQLLFLTYLQRNSKLYCSHETALTYIILLIDLLLFNKQHDKLYIHVSK